MAPAPPPKVAIAAPAPATPPEPPLPPGAFRVGGLTVTLGGFAAAEGVYRSRNEAASIDASFGGIPLPNAANNHIGEYRETAQQSRLSLLTEGQLDDAQKLTAYVETDFLSAGSSSNSTESNSYTLRLREFWGNYDNTDLGLHVLGGQGWSLATLYKSGLIPRQENVPLSIDAQYVVGFDWARQPELRVVKDFADRRIWAGLSLELPQTTFSSAGGPNCLTGAQATTATGGGTLEYTECGGSNVNSIQAYSDNIAPDVIAKLAADPGWGHYELYGLLRFLGGRVSFASSGTGKSYQTTGEGIGGGMILPVLPKLLDFQVSGLVGQGVGRYGTSQLADATFSPTGKIEPLSEFSVMGGFVGHPVPAVDVYAYGGAEGVARKSFSGTTGYGNPNANLSGCEVELGSCSAVTSGVVEGTIGAWWRVIKSAYGTVQAGPGPPTWTATPSRASARRKAARWHHRRTRTWSCSASATCRSSSAARGTAYPFRTPQNTGADPFTSPVIFDRHAACGRYCPSGMLGTEANAAAWKAISCLRRSASSGASIHASYAASSTGSSGQPNQALAPLLRSVLASSGSTYSGPGAPAGNIDHPPLSSGSFDGRRCTTVPQSVICSSTFSPTLRNASTTTMLNAL